MSIILDQIQKQLPLGLPGENSHRKMAPITRMNAAEYQLLKPTAIQSAVNVLLLQKADECTILLTQRPKYQGHHSGQISFPGGKIETTDLSPKEAALRETQEEIGVFTEQQHFVGALTELYIPPSNFWVYPFLHIVQDPVSLNIDPKEVHSMIHFPMPCLLDPKTQSTFEYLSPNGFKLKYPCFKYQDHIIWGATAMILQELKDLIQR